MPPDGVNDRPGRPRAAYVRPYRIGVAKIDFRGKDQGNGNPFCLLNAAFVGRDDPARRFAGTTNQPFGRRAEVVPPYCQVF